MHGVLHREQEAGDGHGFFQVVLRPHADGADGVRDGAVSRQHDHRDVEVFCPEGFQGLETAHLGHHDVEQDEIRGEFSDYFDGLEAICRRVDFVALSLKGFPQKLFERRIVVDQ